MRESLGRKDRDEGEPGKERDEGEPGKERDEGEPGKETMRESLGNGHDPPRPHIEHLMCDRCTPIGILFLS